MGLQVSETFALESVSSSPDVPMEGMRFEIDRPVDEDHVCNHCLTQEIEAVLVS